MPPISRQGPDEIIDAGKPVRGTPPPPESDDKVDTDRRAVERRVFTDRTAKDRSAEEALSKRHK